MRQIYLVFLLLVLLLLLYFVNFYGTLSGFRSEAIGVHTQGNAYSGASDQLDPGMP